MHFHRKVNASISKRRELLATPVISAQSQCLTGNPIDDCWRCDPNWLPTASTWPIALLALARQQWVYNMVIKLKHELIVNNYKTIDGRGANVQITGNGCITLQYVSNVIIHNVHVYNCMPSGNTNIRSSPTHIGWRGKSDGDGISIFGSRNIWIDHCALSHCTDGLVDAIMGSTAITISNNYFSHHDEVMLLGHDDKYLPDSGMQVTIAFNRFGEGLVQRMPRCRRGYMHVVNNDFFEWKMYAIGGSANPTINSEGNRYTAPTDPSAKEVTKREDTNEGEWSDWNWRTDGDIMVNGAFFVPSGEGLGLQYAKASSVEPKSATLIDQLTMNAGVLGGPSPWKWGPFTFWTTWETASCQWGVLENRVSPGPLDMAFVFLEIEWPYCPCIISEFPFCPASLLEFESHQNNSYALNYISSEGTIVGKCARGQQHQHVIRGGTTSTGVSGGSSGGGGGSGGGGDYFGMIFAGGAAVTETSPPNAVFLSILIILILYITTNHGYGGGLND
ncbi:UNVERIFIED_CONTAM: putative pectate lyase 12 [Sesamum calycinum]|uniref:Pectate lyase n=1 Tax=Sesamum calycinum TaxID=2727403 RepID=A0AAW2KV82_9LAMI